MVETVYRIGDQARIQKIIQDTNIHYMHMRFEQNDGLPLHRANSNVYMTVLAGTLTIALDSLPANEYGKGTVLAIPAQALMDVKNQNADTLELTVVKAPAPQA